MHAIRFHRQGPPEVLQLEELSDPIAGPGELLLELRASGVNHLDLWVRRELRGVSLPRIPGADAAGVVKALGPDASGFDLGDSVLIDPGYSCGRCSRCVAGEPTLCRGFGIRGESSDGTYCTHLALPVQACLPLPQGWSFAQGAAFPLVALTAWRMCIERGRLQPGEEVLVLGGAAGVGTLCIQIAKMVGCRVLATASTDEKRRLCRELGADVVLDSRDEDWVKAVRKASRQGAVDVCVDYVGKATWKGSLKVTRSGGRVLTCGATTGHDPIEDLRHIFFRQLSIIGSTMGSKTDLESALGAAADGYLRPVVDRELPLEQAAKAHQLLEDRAVAGKVVLSGGTG